MTDTLALSRAEEWRRRQEAGDAEYLRTIWAADAQGTSELTRGWVRGQSILAQHIAAELPRITDLHLVIEDYAIRRWGAVEVETFLLRQLFIFDGEQGESCAPTTLIWHQEGDAWKLALVHSVALA